MLLKSPQGSGILLMNSMSYKEYSIVPVNNIFTDTLVKTTSSTEAEAFLRKIYPHYSVKEFFYVIHLNNSQQIIGYQKVSEGGITQTSVDLRLIFKMAISLLATNIILSHNHPSGSMKPSDSDIQLTRKIADAGKLLDIHVLDHIILTENGSYSFASEGIL
jgi:DNA repair protein RadC